MKLAQGLRHRHQVVGAKDRASREFFQFETEQQHEMNRGEGTGGHPWGWTCRGALKISAASV